MQPIGKRLVAAMEPIKTAFSSQGFLLVAAGANEKKARVRFFCKNYLCNFIGLFVSPAFLFLVFNNSPATG